MKEANEIKVQVRSTLFVKCIPLIFELFLDFAVWRKSLIFHIEFCGSALFYTMHFLFLDGQIRGFDAGLPGQKGRRGSSIGEDHGGAAGGHRRTACPAGGCSGTVQLLLPVLLIHKIVQLVYMHDNHVQLDLFANDLPL